MIVNIESISLNNIVSKLIFICIDRDSRDVLTQCYNYVNIIILGNFFSTKVSQIVFDY